MKSNPEPWAFVGGSLEDDWFTSDAEFGGPANNFDRDGFKYDVRNGKFPDRSSYLPHVPSTIRNVIKRCLDTDPAKRYSSAVEVANAMAEIEGNCLDWQLTAHADKNVWTKNEKGTEYEFTVHKDGHSDCYKSVDGGLRRRVAAACKPGMTDRDLRKVFTGY